MIPSTILVFERRSNRGAIGLEKVGLRQRESGRGNWQEGPGEPLNFSLGSFEMP